MPGAGRWQRQSTLACPGLAGDPGCAQGDHPSPPGSVGDRRDRVLSTPSMPPGAASAASAPSPSSGPERHGPLTMVVARRIKAGCEAAYEEWVHGVLAVAESFPGHEGATLLRPGAVEDREYVLVIRWATFEDLRRWQESPERSDWLRR